MSRFRKATKEKSRARVGLIGPSGSGKTFTALRIATGLGGPIAVLDTERGSASKYAGIFEFDVDEPETFEPEECIESIRSAVEGGYRVLIIDSLSHFWMGKGGALEQVDHEAKRSRSQNSFAAWREVTPRHNAMVDAIVRAPMHVIATMRSKTEWVIEENERGKKVPRKLGLAPIQRDGLEYEFDVVGDLNNAELVISKTRCPAFNGGVYREPGEDFAKTLRDWLDDGVEPAPPDYAAIRDDYLGRYEGVGGAGEFRKLNAEFAASRNGMPEEMLSEVREAAEAAKERINKAVNEAEVSA